MKKSKRLPTKLQLTVETIRVLRVRELDHVAGASGFPCLYKTNASMVCCPTTMTH